ncbi:hypothetical protein PCASD_07170 [Puccinia coronata f. sp. avenae]|uniref:Uncharacterized protein n=1 Tax=Puccinia coronata f. sp. avenae TaxID=200324 RepID=A0A2N5UUN3_9BASI|nr:hypothetical protein PCASD_07170 [Puccinia coronata f. sp. avenae]
MGQRIVLSDGGTALEDELGYTLGSAPLWASELLLTRPHTLATLHRAWEAADNISCPPSGYDGLSHACLARPVITFD